MKIVVLFDLDGTLVESFTTNVLPCVPETLQTLRERGVKIGICTNQAGPAWRIATTQAKYPTPDKVAQNIFAIAEALGLKGDPWFISLNDERVLALPDGHESVHLAYLEMVNTFNRLNRSVLSSYISTNLNWRKPEPGMIRAAMEVFQVTKSTKVFYVGDMASDKEVAQRAGVHFIHANDLKDVPSLINL